MTRLRRAIPLLFGILPGMLASAGNRPLAARAPAPAAVPPALAVLVASVAHRSPTTSVLLVRAVPLGAATSTALPGLEAISEGPGDDGVPTRRAGAGRRPHGAAVVAPRPALRRAGTAGPPGGVVPRLALRRAALRSAPSLPQPPPSTF